MGNPLLWESTRGTSSLVYFCWVRQIRGNHIFVQSKHVIASLGNLILQQSLIPKRILKNPKIQTCPVQQKHTFTIKEQRQNQKTSHSIAARNNQKPKGICRIPIKSHFFSVKQPFSHGFPWFSYGFL